jgi:hypothetical protein
MFIATGIKSVIFISENEKKTLRFEGAWLWFIMQRENKYNSKITVSKFFCV